LGGREKSVIRRRESEGPECLPDQSYRILKKKVQLKGTIAISNGRKTKGGGPNRTSKGFRSSKGARLEIQKELYATAKKRTLRRGPSRPPGLGGTTSGCPDHLHCRIHISYLLIKGFARRKKQRGGGKNLGGRTIKRGKTVGAGQDKLRGKGENRKKKN